MQTRITFLQSDEDGRNVGYTLGAELMLGDVLGMSLGLKVGELEGDELGVQVGCKLGDELGMSLG